METELSIEPQSLKKLSFKSLKRSLDLFSPTHGQIPPPDAESSKIRISHKLNSDYVRVKTMSSEHATNAAKSQVQQEPTPSNALALPGPQQSNDTQMGGPPKDLVIGSTGQPRGSADAGGQGRSSAIIPSNVSSERNMSTSAIMERIPSRWPRPVWRAPWKNYRVISGHLGWVRSVAIDPSNTWFCTGSADRTIKIWDLASGRLKLTLTGHIDQVRGLAVSNKHTYMFSAGDDKLVKCWDLEQNKVIRSYHGHLSGVYCLALHPTIDILLTGGRDSVCRVWDIRSKAQIRTLPGHDNTVCSVFTRPTDPQVITGSHDSTIKLWDLRTGKTMSTLTHHKKSVRAMAPHPTEDCFVSASAENIKKFRLPRGEFMHNMLSQQKTIINAAAVNEEGVLATAGDNGSLWFWDWNSGHNFQQAQTIVQPGSLESEAGIYSIMYDLTGSRLITCEADKTIKMWKEDETATPETHPLHFKPPRDMRRF
ncbi:protein pleiotropic regulatory locus 1-like [Salvia splendens]|uniref:protein pleiotropic regulatory locus 1-like n=1 Tax=Salvia splendens TaxID=180675 RepID=UPI001C255EF0|nr:protein pleiotropic regulatory locus 1-like [Salvia splendens]XP_042046376.1 protein pleiotropic regulatory locus 1-like [Salvia splendens]